MPQVGERTVAVVFVAALGLVAGWTAWVGVAPADVALVPCPVHAVAGVPCPGCGMTRACVALVRGDVGAAWTLHPFALLLVPLALAWAVEPRWLQSGWRRLGAGGRAGVAVAGIALVVVRWVGLLTGAPAAPV